MWLSISCNFYMLDECVYNKLWCKEIEKFKYLNKMLVILLNFRVLK